MDNVSRTIANLEKNGFHVQHFNSGEEAAQWCLSQARPGLTAACGGSLTLSQLDLAERLQELGVDLVRHSGPGLSKEEARLNMRRELLADLYFCSANAITEQGWIFNTDGTGNRVAATILGPERVFLVVSVDKIVPDLAAAQARVARIAPLNCQRLKFDTPCALSGRCEDCDSPARSCRVEVTLKRPPRTVDITVVLVDEKLGL